MRVSKAKSPPTVAPVERAPSDDPTRKDHDEDSAATTTPQARWASRNPKAVWAHAALRSALRRGLIQRGPCEVCGASEVDGHHDDYDQPMRVRWLCRKHHKAAHRLVCEEVADA